MTRRSSVAHRLAGRPGQALGCVVAPTLAALIVVQALGCGGDRDQAQMAPIRGKVSYRGKALPHGQIVMVHASGRMAAAEIGPDGGYQLEAPIGENKVMVQCTDEPNLSKISPKAGRALRIPKSLIPVRYTDYVSSGLAVTVTAGENTRDWELTD